MNHQFPLLSQIASPFFRDVLEKGLRECVPYFGDRLAAVYVRGSVHRNEAFPGVSDIDALLFVEDGPTTEDKEWRQAANESLQKRHPFGAWGWLPPAHSVAHLTPPLPTAGEGYLRYRAWSNILHWDATRIYGRDLPAGHVSPPMTREWAAASFETPWNVARHAADLPLATNAPENREEVGFYPLPENPAPRLRKLARLAVLGGAYYLGGHNQWSGLCGAVVFPLLHAELPQWGDFFTETERLYITPTMADERDAQNYRERLVLWMDFVGESLAVTIQLYDG